jgi:Tol biopolymer transport system component
LKIRVDRLDRAALAFVAALLVIIILLIVRGDQVGIRVTRTAPVDLTQDVSTRAQVALTFSEAMPAAAMDGRIQISPPLSGTWRWSGTTAYFVPTGVLQQDTAYTVTVLPGAQSAKGRMMLHGLTWGFRTGHPRVVYLYPATDIGNLYVQEVTQNATRRRLTDEPLGIYDFAVSPDGLRIVYSATRQNGARDLWVINADGTGQQQLVACDQQVCQSPSWSADGTRIAFERHTLVQGALGVSPGPAHIYLYDFSSQSSTPLMNDSQQLGNLPIWAPVGDTLAFYDPTASMITLYNVVSGERVQLSSVMGDPGAWSPDGQQLIYPDLKATDSGQYNQLLRADLVSGVITPVMPLSASNDASVSWSPVGMQIAFTRQHISTAGATGGVIPFGPQVWVSSPQGAEVHALTDQEGYSYGGLAFSPDGEWIVAVRNNLQMPNPKPQLWLMRKDGSQQSQLAEDATIPAWLP